MSSHWCICHLTSCEVARKMLSVIESLLSSSGLATVLYVLYDIADFCVLLRSFNLFHVYTYLWAEFFSYVHFKSYLILLYTVQLYMYIVQLYIQYCIVKAALLKISQIYCRCKNEWNYPCYNTNNFVSINKHNYAVIFSYFTQIVCVITWTILLHLRIYIHIHLRTF